jgi:hypothetical protein
MLLAQLAVCFTVYLRHPDIFSEGLVWKLLGSLLPHRVQELAPVAPVHTVKLSNGEFKDIRSAAGRHTTVRRSPR